MSGSYPVELEKRLSRMFVALAGRDPVTVRQWAALSGVSEAAARSELEDFRRRHIVEYAGSGYRASGVFG